MAIIEFIAPDWVLWKWFILAQCFITVYFCTIGLFTYICLKHMDKYKNLRLGGLILLWTCGIAAPFWIILKLHVTNYVIRMTLCICCIVAMFKQVEAILGTTPPGVLDKLESWLVYFSSSVEPIYENGRPMKPIPGQFVKYIYLILSKGLMMSGLMSLGFSTSSPLLPFSSSGEQGGTLFSADYGHFLKSVATFGCKLGNNAYHTALICVMLGILSNVLAFVLCLVGYRPSDIMRNPLMLSLSPREFWGQRWNLIIHGILKRSYYVPIRRRFGVAAGSATAFVVSGLFHELLWYMLFCGSQPNSYRPGEVFYFFFLMFILCCLPWPGTKNVRESKPWLTPLFTLATLLPGLCVAHHFTGPLVDRNVLTAFSKLVPIVIVHPSGF